MNGCFKFLIGLCCVATAAAWGMRAQVLESEIASVSAELAMLPEIQPSVMPWTRGLSYHCNRQPDKPVVVTVTFDQPASVDLVALMPTTFLNEDNQLLSDGFPVRFLLEGVADKGAIPIADYRTRDYPKPGVEPQLFRCIKPALLRGLRLTVTRHAPNQIWSAPSHSMALSEVMAFAGPKNVALNAQVDAPGSRDYGNVWTAEALVDGFTLFSPIDYRQREPNKEYIWTQPRLVVDFEFDEMQSVDEFWIWPLANRYFTPASGIGFPQKIAVAACSDYGEWRLIYEADTLPRPGANPLMQRMDPVRARRFRLSFSRALTDFRTDSDTRMILGEIQLLGNGITRTNGLNISILDPQLGSEKGAPLSALIDGRTNEGTIIPLRRWVEQFQRRAQLQRRLTGFRTQLLAARQQERERFRLLGVVAIAVIVILALLVQVVRLLAARKWERVREQIACDLHDQIGANLSSIAHSNELIRRTIKDPTNLQRDLLCDTIETAQSTARETRQIVKYLEGRGSDERLVAQMSKTARQILGAIDSTCHWMEFSDSKVLNPSRQWDLLLFFKEVLNNVIKHSGASHVEIDVERVGRGLRLTIHDNGCGIPDNRLPLRHLEKRARRLNGTMTVETGPVQGTRITLQLTRGFFQ